MIVSDVPFHNGSDDGDDEDEDEYGGYIRIPGYVADDAGGGIAETNA